MNSLQRAEDLFDEAERQFDAAKRASSAGRESDAHRHYQFACECRDEANTLLDQVVRPKLRIAG